MRKFLIASILVVGLGSGAAVAQSVGNVTGISGDVGQVIVQRGAETFSLGPDDQIFPGDKVTTRAGGTVELSAYGCSVSVPSEAAITVGPDFCTTPPTILASQTAPAPQPVIAAGGGGANTGLLIGAGVLGAVGIAAAGGGGGGGSDRPASP